MTQDGNELLLSSEACVDLMKTAFEKHAFFRMRVKGFSMWPFIKNRDIVTICAPAHINIYTGMVAAFSHPKTKKLIIHRVIGRNSLHFYIKGDNVTGPDGVIPMQDIIGIITGVERHGKKCLCGLGIERHVIALLSRINLFPSLLRLRKLPMFLKRRFI